MDTFLDAFDRMRRLVLLDVAVGHAGFISRYDEDRKKMTWEQLSAVSDHANGSRVIYFPLPGAIAGAYPQKLLLSRN